MLPAMTTESTSSLRKEEPLAKLPSEAVLAQLSEEDVDTIRRRLSEPVECIYNAVFEDRGAEALFGTPFPYDQTTRRAKAANDDSGVHALEDGTSVAEVATDEQHLFLRLNYQRYRIMLLLRAFSGRRISAAGAAELLKWERLLSETRSEIVRANVPLVLAMAKRTRITGVDFSDLISEGNLALLRSVEKFDCGRGFKFSTYACRAILKSFSRVASRAARYRGHFPTEFDPTLEKSTFLDQKRGGVEDDCVSELKNILGNNVAKLNTIEQQVIKARFALNETTEDRARAKTLEQVGQMIGVTKERVRQIQNKALSKLRDVLEEGVLAG